MRTTRCSHNAPWHLRVRHARARAQLRYERRRRRCKAIYAQIQDFYGNAPRLRARWWLNDPWSHKRVKWVYDDALALEDEALVLMNRLAIIAADPASRGKPWLSLPERQAEEPLT